MLEKIGGMDERFFLYFEEALVRNKNAGPPSTLAYFLGKVTPTPLLRHTHRNWHAQIGHGIHGRDAGMYFHNLCAE